MQTMQKKRKGFGFWFAIIILLMAMMYMIQTKTDSVNQPVYSNLVVDIKNEKVEFLRIEDKNVTAKLKDTPL